METDLLLPTYYSLHEPEQKRYIKNCLLIIVFLEAVNFVFSYFWVIGFARQLDNTYLRDSGSQSVYGVFMVLFNILAVGIESTLIFKGNYDANFVKPIKIWVVLVFFLFTVMHVGAPFIATRIAQEADYADFCSGWNNQYLVDNGGLVRYKGNSGQITIADMDSEHIIISVFDPYSLDAASIVLNRKGQGIITGSCITQEGCINGSVSLRVRSKLFASFRNFNQTLSISPRDQWWQKPVSLQGIDNGILSTIGPEKPFTDDFKVCFNQSVAGIMTLLVIGLQSRGSVCSKCWEQCRACCEEQCYPVERYSISCWKGRCSTYTYYSKRCDCVRCEVTKCQSICYNDCKGISMLE